MGRILSCHSCLCVGMKTCQKLATIGRILSHCVALTSVFPIRLSLVTIMSVVFGSDSVVPEDQLIDDFSSFSCGGRKKSSANGLIQLW